MDDEAYEIQRQANIAENLALLQSLGLSERKSSSSKGIHRKGSDKKKVTKDSSRKRAKLSNSDNVGDSSTRRSGRIRKNVVYFAEQSPNIKPLITKSRRAKSSSFMETDSEDDTENGAVNGEADYVDSNRDRRQFFPSTMLLRKAQRLGIREEDPKQFGHIPGQPVGTWWATRMDCSTDAVHAPTVAGISGNTEDGCYSLALSGGYTDDIDLGDRFTYTGSGGRKLQGMQNGKRLNLRTAPQSFDQSFSDKCNAALLTSSKKGNPIRVIRGYKGSSIWTPLEGYLYSGLYICTRAWLADGLSGFKVCKYAFKRLPNQDPLPVVNRTTGSISISSSSRPSRLPFTPRCNHTNCRVEVVIPTKPRKML